MIIRFTDPVIGDLELTEDIIVPITLSVGDIRDVSKRSGSFSKTIIIPGTKNNNQVLRNLFDPNAVDDFGVESVKRCQIIDKDGLIVKDNLIFQLVKVVQRQDNVLSFDEVDWECIVKDSVADFFTKINNKELTDISKAKFDSLNHTWNALSIINSFGNFEPDGYKYWLPQQTTSQFSPVLPPSAYDINDIPLAIYAKKYWDWIHAEAGFSYDWDTKSDPFVLFDKLLVTDNKTRRELNDLAAQSNKIETDLFLNFPERKFVYRGNFNTPLDYLSSSNNFTINYRTTDESSPAIISVIDQSLLPPPGNNFSKFDNDTEPIIAISQNGATNPLGYSVYTKQSSLVEKIIVSTNIQVKLIRRVQESSVFKVYDNSSTGTDRPRIEVYLSVLNVTQGGQYRTKLSEVYPQDFNNNIFEGSSTLSDNLNIILNQQIETELDFGGNNGDQILFRFEMKFVPSPNNSLSNQERFGFQKPFIAGWLDIDPYLIIGQTSLDIIPTGLDVGSTMPVVAWVPKKIKQSDFIKSIATMYNLYATTDPLNPTKIIWKHRDKFYDEGPTLDWTQKLAKDQPQETIYLPELVNKKLLLTYKSDGDPANKTYTDSTREIYGQQEVIFNSEFVKDTDTKELIFSPTPINYNYIGGTAPVIDASEANNVRILIDGGIRNTSNLLGIVEEFPLSIITSNVYPQTTHFSGEYGGGLDINFGPCDFYFFSIQPEAIPQTNLFNLFWRRTAAQIDKGRMLEAYFHLTNNDISTFTLDSKIKLENSYWIINKVIDFNPNEDGLTKVELLSLEDSVNLNLNLTNINDQSGLAPTNELKANQLIPFLQNNIRNSQILTDDPVILMKSGMVVPQGRKGLIIDENVSITDEGLSTSNVKINQDSIEFGAINATNIIQGLNDTIEIGTSEGGVGYSLLRTTSNTLSIEAKDSVTDTISIISLQGNDISLFVNDGVNSKEIFLTKDRLVINGLTPYADDADAALGGLIAGDIYQTNGLGALPAGIVMIKQ